MEQLYSVIQQKPTAYENAANLQEGYCVNDNHGKIYLTANSSENPCKTLQCMEQLYNVIQQKPTAYENADNLQEGYCVNDNHGKIYLTAKSSENPCQTYQCIEGLYNVIQQNPTAYEKRTNNDLGFCVSDNHGTLFFSDKRSCSSNQCIKADQTAIMWPIVYSGDVGKVITSAECMEYATFFGKQYLGEQSTISEFFTSAECMEYATSTGQTHLGDHPSEYMPTGCLEESVQQLIYYNPTVSDVACDAIPGWICVQKTQTPPGGCVEHFIDGSLTGNVFYNSIVGETPCGGDDGTLVCILKQNPVLECENCAVGRYDNDINKGYPQHDKCIKCETGKYEDVTGSTGCKNCQAGKYNHELENVACYDCPAGKESIEGTIAIEDCTDCEAGKFSTGGGRLCEPCAKNFYASDTGTVSCTACETYDFTPSTGATECFARFQEFTLSTTSSASRVYNGKYYWGGPEHSYQEYIRNFCGNKGFMDAWKSHAQQYKLAVGSHCDTSDHHAWYDDSDMRFGGGVVRPFRSCPDNDDHHKTSEAQIQQYSTQQSEGYQDCQWMQSCRCQTCQHTCEICEWRYRYVTRWYDLGYLQNRILCRVEDEGVTYTQTTSHVATSNKYINRQQCKWYAQRQGVHFAGDYSSTSPQGCFLHGGDYWYSWQWSTPCSTTYKCVIHDAE